ncbi:MAG TPA: acyltransferase [Polyangiaceae bacterium]|jgi:acetyltransferase-like isoleucine patch superfamily enzyme
MSSLAWSKLVNAIRGETSSFHPRLRALNLAVGALPKGVAGEQRARLYALAGFRIGRHTKVFGTLRLNGGSELFSHLAIGESCSIEPDCAFDLEEQITIGDRVTIDPGVMILTSTHELASRERRAGDVQRQPVVIGDGAWLQARSIILPGVTIGAGAIVSHGAVVNKDVAQHTRVGGTPATQLELLEQEPPTPQAD